MKILVTGSNGQLGSEIRQLVVSSANEYIFTDVAELDITDRNAVFDAVREREINVIINCAAYTAVDKAEDDEVSADRINHIAVKNLAEAALSSNALLVHVSTDYVFGGTKNLPFSEEDDVNPLGVYGRTKLAGEKAVTESGCRSVIIRTAWLYSSFGNNFVKTMLRLTSEKENIKVVYDQIGTPTYAGDLAAAIFNLVESNGFIGNEGIYHYTNEGVCSWFDFAKEIAEISGHTKCRIFSCRSEEFPSKVKRPAYSVLDKAKFRNTFNIEIPYWKDSLKKCMKKMI